MVWPNSYFGHRGESINLQLLKKKNGIYIRLTFLIFFYFINSDIFEILVNIFKLNIESSH